MLFSNRSQSLLLASEVYSALGYAVIPLLGDLSPDRPKAPAVPWSDYQKRKPTPHEVHHWFAHEGFQGIGILTGRISALVVLDFDSEALFRTFSAQHPDLVEHQVVQTRRGFHVYFHLPPHLSLPSRALPGIDLLAGGRYVVARPTSIAGFTYTLLKGGMPTSLTPHDLARIARFLDQVAPAPEPAPRPVAPVAANTPAPLQPADLHALYRSHIGQGGGRNEALFLTTLTARDSGCSQPVVVAALADLHAGTPSASHPPESETQRYHEAQRTIASAFSRPPRPRQPARVQSPQLPTRAREQLYSWGLTCVVRLIEGLREKGLPPGQSFTRQQALFLLEGLVGRHSIDKALHATTASGQRLFERAIPPLHPPRSAASHSHAPDPPKCFLGSPTKPEIIPRGRRIQHYRLPTNAALCQLLGIRRLSSDRLDLADLHSARQTRLAAHRALIQRRPGQYYRQWLAARLGVSARTTQRYDLALHVHVRPMFHETAITWQTLQRLPDFLLDGTCLQDETGQRYPARREIARHLLQAGHRLTYRRQLANFYSLDAPQVVQFQVAALEQVWQERLRQIEARLAAEEKKAGDIPASPTPPALLPRAAVPSPAAKPENSSLTQPQTRPKPAPRVSARRYRQPLPDAAQEALAQRLYTTLNQRAGEARLHISQATARRCVETYGAAAVDRALRLLLRRSNIAKPAGFFLTVLRSASKQG